jgi:UDP-GlcNAc:undecaprenyl-phosphate/decaprenyl-phosphate GlcNAc-1-phosphate transferase
VTATLILIFVGTVVAALLLVPLAWWLGVRAGIVDRPRPGELQRWPRARTGGYGIVAAFLVGVGLSLLLVPRGDSEEAARLVGFAVGLAVVLPVALLDDRLRLGPRPQLLGQILAAVLPIPFGLYITDVSGPWGQILPLPILLAIPFSVVWVVGMINTLNWLDTVDGLAGGTAAIAAAILLWRSLDLGQYSVAVLPLALLAACLGFLAFNFNPARVFMGTSGSMFLGYALAMLAIFGGAKIATALMVLGIPILDTALVIVQRVVAGRSPLQGGDNAHLSHRLALRGWGARRIALSAYACCLILGVGGLALSGQHKALLFAGVLLAVVVAAALLALRPRADRTPAHR